MSGNWGLLRKSGAILGVIYYNVSVEKYSRLMGEVIRVYFEKDDLGFGALNCSSFLSDTLLMKALGMKLFGPQSTFFLDKVYK